jgi:hypothetical protein
MKTLSTIVALTMAASCLSISNNVAASTVTLKPVNDKFATQVCYTAGTSGLESAIALIRENGYTYQSFKSDLTCNGVSVGSFASKYALTPEKNQVASVTNVKLVATDNAAQVCVDAVLLGEDVAREKYDAKGEPILCNDKPIQQFVRSFKDRKVIL